jgi:hypothetical protein
MNEEQTIGAMIEAAKPTAPRITPADVEANIAGEHYFTARDGVDGEWQSRHDITDYRSDKVPAALDLLTFCVLVLRNGFTVTGESACASPENFNAEIGQRVARQAAVAKIWPLLGYELRTQLADDERSALAFEDPQDDIPF